MRWDRQLEFFFFGKKKKKSASRDEARRVSEDPVRVGGTDVMPAGVDGRLTEQCAARLRQQGMDDLANKVVVVWNARMRSTAGRAFWPEGKIELNPKLREVAPGEVEATMLHELAHLLAYARAGRRRIAAHGAEWRQACRDLGIPGERATHSLPLPGRTLKRRWRYSCPECGAGFERVRRMKRYAGCYPCCKRHNGGYYDKRFRLVESELDAGLSD